MKKTLLLGLLALAGAQSAFAIFQWDVYVGDLDAVNCWNPESCDADVATVYMHNPANPAETYALDCEIHQTGFPVAFNFVANYDADLNCALSYLVDSLRADFSGPGFEYGFTHVPAPFSMFYMCGPNFPTLIDCPPGDGCVFEEVGNEWTWEVYPAGRVDLTGDYTLPAGETLNVDPGIEVYGLSETTGGISFNRYGKVRFGSVGTPLPQVEAKLAPDGEILARGPNVFLGYYKNEEATREALVDGWLRTGDLGTMDATIAVTTGAAEPFDGNR